MRREAWGSEAELALPGGKRFAFSIFDDTDVATVDSIRPIYDFLHALGIYTTKSVWGIDHAGPSAFAGSHTLENDRYADYVRELRARGFEIGFHGATMESATREEIARSFKNFEKVVGQPPAIYAAHGVNRDNLYWGAGRLGFRATRLLYALFRREPLDYFQGQEPNSAHYWGDLAARHLKYARGFTFARMNLLELRLPLVYQRPDTPCVQNWFITCDAENVAGFNSLLRSSRQAELEAKRGLCIVSTHFGKGFVERGRLHPVTKRLLEELAARDGWFVPVSEILDLWVAERGAPQLAGFPLLSMEFRWALDSLKRRLGRHEYEPTELAYLGRSTGGSAGGESA